MRIVTWNCNGALRKKYQHVSECDADIYIIQECENPILTRDAGYQEWAINHLWIGDTKNKGLGIFAKSGIVISPLNWSATYQDHEVKLFLPCTINGQLQLLGVWTKHNNSPNFGYIGQFWKYMQVNKASFDKIIIAGDFNSNKRWDAWDRWWNHSDVVKELDTMGIKSLYHLMRNEEQGKETIPTFFMNRNLEKGYHIDYVFISDGYTATAIEIPATIDWLLYSDHLPLVAEINI
jgi:endonuclease/exonuclease/phosphatase family metal-dependent hydrolase